jgi:hypothetical protein
VNENTFEWISVGLTFALYFMFAWSFKRASYVFIASAAVAGALSAFYMLRDGTLETGGIAQTISGGVTGLLFFYLINWIRKKCQ